MPMKQKTEGAASTGALIFGLVALAFGFAAGYVAGEKQAMKSQSSPRGGSPVAGREGARPDDPEQAAFLSVNGVVKAIEGSTMLLESRAAEGGSITYRVNVTASTEISVSKNLTAEEFEAAQKKFVADEKAYADARGSDKDVPPPVPPEPFRMVKGPSADLKAGQYVAVISTAPIAGDAFSAASVTVTSEPATAPAVPPLPTESEE